MSKFKIPKYIIKCAQNIGFEYKGMKAAGVTDYTNQTPQPFWMEKCPSSTENIFQMCTK